MAASRLVGLAFRVRRTWKHPWVNILILVFVTVEFISGFWGLVSGSRDEAVFIIIHRIAGYGLVVLMVWKVAIILFALRNRKRGRMERTASLVLFGLLMVTLGLGFAWSAAGPYYYRPPSGITWSGVSWHIYVSVLLIPLVVSHAIAYIRSFPLPLTFWVERRAFLRFAGIALAGLVFWQTGEQVVRAVGLSGKDRRSQARTGRRASTGSSPWSRGSTMCRHRPTSTHGDCPCTGWSSATCRSATPT